MADFNIKVGINDAAVHRGLAGIGRKANGLNKAFGKLATTSALWAAALATAGVAFTAFKGIQFLKDSSKIASDMGLVEASFKVLLGTAEKAKTRLKELKDFSVVTPFEPKQVIEASRSLQAFGGDILATGKGLTLVGDAAAGANKDLQVVAENVGKVFLGLTQGGEVAEAANQLQNMGVLTNGFRKRWMDLATAQRAGKAPLLKSVEAIGELEKGLNKTTGAMSELSREFGGKVSTLKGNIDLFKESVGKGINAALVDGLDRMNTTLPEWQAGGRKIGEGIGLAISQGLRGEFGLVETALTAMFLRAGEVAMGALAQGMTTASTKVLPEILKGGADIAKAIGDKIPGPAKGGARLNEIGLRAAAFGLDNLEADADKFDLSDFQNLTRGSLGSDEVLEKFDTLIRLEMERQFQEGRRDKDKYGDFGPLKYSR